MKSDEVIAVVTGGSSGLGKECARLLHARGIDTCLVGRDLDRLEVAATELSRDGVRPLTVAADLGEPGGAQCVRAHLGDHGRSAMWLLNVAGVGAFGPVTDYLVGVKKQLPVCGRESWTEGRARASMT